MLKEDSFLVLTTIGSLSADGFFIYNISSSEVEYLNHAMVKIFDISHESFRHQPDFFINHIIPEDLDHILEQYEVLKQQSVVESVEFHLSMHDKTIKTISCNAYAIGNRVIGIVRDLTKHREHEAYITNFGAKKDTLLDMVSHNLSGPLNLTQSILTSIDKLIHPQSDQNLRPQLRIVQDATNQCIEIINDFLEEEHLTSEHISVKRTRFDVIETINSILERMRGSYKEKHFILITDSHAIYAETDEVKLMQIIQNLLSNAIKFTRTNGRIEVNVSQKAKSFTITVKDNGIGIPEHLKPLIFDKYTPAGREGVNGERSIGMGLYIVKQLVAILNGRLEYESAEGRGTVFTIHFPKD